MYLNADDIKQLMRQRYSAPQYALFFEVTDQTGARHTGYADAIAMGLWPSRGIELEGFEIKVSSSDWRRELAKPAKAEKFAQRCDRWWLVAADGVVKDETEIPSGWGWIVATDKLRIAKQAPKLEPMPLDHYFLAAILRSAAEFRQRALDAAIMDRVKAMRAGDEKTIASRVKAQRDASVDDHALMTKVRKLLGRDDELAYLNEDEMAAAIVAVYRSGVAGAYKGLAYAATMLESAAAQVRSARQGLPLPEIKAK